MQGQVHFGQPRLQQTQLNACNRFDVLGIWRERGTNVSGKVMPGGHTFQYESPRETLAELRAFLAA